MEDANIETEQAEEDEDVLIINTAIDMASQSTSWPKQRSCYYKNIIIIRKV